jgi:hypothetical protein
MPRKRDQVEGSGHIPPANLIRRPVIEPPMERIQHEKPEVFRIIEEHVDDLIDEATR